MEGASLQTALHLSVRYAALSSVQILARYGANVNAVDSSGMTPLHMAAGILHKDITASLIRQGADINMVWHFFLPYTLTMRHRGYFLSSFLNFKYLSVTFSRGCSTQETLLCT